MNYAEFNRNHIHYAPLSKRENKLHILTIDQDCKNEKLSDNLLQRLEPIAQEILQARRRNASVVCTFGAHTIKNGLGHTLSSCIEEGWFTHLATNGAGIIHDWEFSYQGKSSEDVRANVREGQFGTWEETGFYINLALIIGAYEGRGYGESVGSMIQRQGLHIPTRDELLEIITHRRVLWKSAAAADLLESIDAFQIPEGWMSIPHQYRDYSIQAKAFQLNVPFTGHPMFGHDIIYTHSMNKGAAVGRTAEHDFLRFVESISNLEGGVYLSIGSAIMSPMIFEKALSMTRNVAKQNGCDISDCSIIVVDLQPETWDWARGEPPMENPAYYLRFMKTFNRMGCRIDYLCMDNRQFLTGLNHVLTRLTKQMKKVES